MFTRRLVRLRNLKCVIKTRALISNVVFRSQSRPPFPNQSFHTTCRTLLKAKTINKEKPLPFPVSILTDKELINVSKMDIQFSLLAGGGALLLAFKLCVPYLHLFFDVIYIHVECAYTCNTFLLTALVLSNNIYVVNPSRGCSKLLHNSTH